MPAPRLLVIEGNTAEGRALLKAAGGDAPSEGYADLLRELLPGASSTSATRPIPAQSCPSRPAWKAMTASPSPARRCTSMKAGPEIERQVELVRAVLAAGTPMFGSCWGLQVLTVAAGGSVRRNPKGREIGFGRRIRLTNPAAATRCMSARTRCSTR